MKTDRAFVFVHGFMGTDEVRLPFYAFECFRGLRRLRAHLDVPILAARLPRNAGVAERGEVLARFLESAGYARYALIGHSMGGLVSRHVAARLDPDRKIRAVSTLATPHHGSVLAEDALRGWNPFHVLVRRVAQEALENLTPAFCQTFNAETPNRGDVLYLSYGAARPLTEMPIWARQWGRRLAKSGGDNDGQVTLASARWTGFQPEILRADHWELLGWGIALPNRAEGRPFDNVALYKRVIEEIRTQANWQAGAP